MNCYTHKNITACGVCKNCGGGVCDTCASEFPALCPACSIKTAQEKIKRLKQSNRILLYVGLFFAIVFGVVSVIAYMTDENPLWFLLNSPTLVLTLIFLLLFRKNSRKKLAAKNDIKKFEDLASRNLQDESHEAEKFNFDDIIPVIKDTIKTELKQLKNRPIVQAESGTQKTVSTGNLEGIETTVTKKEKTIVKEPKTKEKNNPFVSESAHEPTTKTVSKNKNVKKVWTCDCGKENLTQKLFCMDCGLKRTKEMLANAKEI